MLPTVLDGVVDDARKAVMGDLKTSIRGVLDGVGVDDRRCSSVDRDAEGAPSHREAFDRDLTAKDLDRRPTRICRLDVALRCPSRVMRWSSAWIRIFS